MIERGIVAGNVRPNLDAHAEAVHVCGTLFGLTLQWLIDPAGARLETILQRLKERLVEELGAG